MSKAKYWVNLNFDLMMSLNEKLGDTKVIKIHPNRNMDVCTKCNGNPSNNCCDISLKTTKSTDTAIPREMPLG